MAPLNREFAAQRIHYRLQPDRTRRKTVYEKIYRERYHGAA